jgi:Polyketide cyclase / dehydrase and lipid transport
MTSSTGQQQSSGGLLGSLARNPAVSRLGEAARDYARARGTDAARRMGQKLSGVTDSLNDTAENGGFKATAAGEAVKRVVAGENPVKAAVSGIGSGITEKVGGLFGRAKSGGAGGNKKFMNIVEDIAVGVPVDVAYDQWTQFQEFASFMKGVKVFKSRRNWKATVTEQIPDRKIAWTTEGAKGTTKGVVTFHPLADDLTQILLVLEYYPQGLFEKTGNLWRAQGRRTRLDLKHFRRFIMLRGEATGSWRGEIRDGQVVRSPDEEPSEERRTEAPDDSTQQAGDGRVRSTERATARADSGDADSGDQDTAEEDLPEETAEPEEAPEEGAEERERAEDERPRRPRRRQPAGAR